MDSISGHQGIHALTTWAQMRGLPFSFVAAKVVTVIAFSAIPNQTMEAIYIRTYPLGETDHAPTSWLISLLTALLRVGLSDMPPQLLNTYTRLPLGVLTH